MPQNFHGSGYSDRMAWRLRDAAIALSVSTETLQKLAKNGRLTLVRIGGRILVPDSEIRRLARGEEA